ncbi:hypothetical protein [Sphingomonas sp. 1P08PE]|uniref:hypothetical protein n=1 Tax=Sphingomonas sp. 1P08PE TaxID=554122 RepID=UPI0039A2F87E
MPDNTGRAPRHELVDIRFRNGTIARSVDPSKYRWSLDDPKFGGASPGDVVSWQPSKN